MRKVEIVDRKNLMIMLASVSVLGLIIWAILWANKKELHI